jgi:hypothetical protein
MIQIQYLLLLLHAIAIRAQRAAQLRLQRQWFVRRGEHVR